jgi:poly-gamma-glutamate system protein
VSLVFYLSSEALFPADRLEWTPSMHHAARVMGEALLVVRDHCEANGIVIDTAIDPNRTGLIGPETGGLMTTVGHLAAKRTTTSPEVAGLMVHLLERAGVQPGDRVGIGCSASFPGLLIATVAAVEAKGALPVTILSLGASSYGATRPEFHLLDLHQLLLAAGVFRTPPVAVSLGGDRDMALELEPSSRDRLTAQILASGSPFILESDLEANVEKRMALYLGSRREKKLAAYVNIGGSHASFGASPFVLGLRPGLVELDGPLPSEGRGVLVAMLEAGIPVLHLLYIKGLAMRYGMAWDPVPLPAPGESELRDPQALPGTPAVLLTGLYFAALLGVLAAFRAQG